MYGIYTNIGGIFMVNVTIYSIHGSYGVRIGVECWTMQHRNRLHRAWNSQSQQPSVLRNLTPGALQFLDLRLQRIPQHHVINGRSQKIESASGIFHMIWGWVTNETIFEAMFWSIDMGSWHLSGFLSGSPFFWANYNNSLTWIKAIWGWVPLLTMISSELVVSSL